MTSFQPNEVIGRLRTACIDTDIAYNEDRCRVRKDNAPGNFSIIRKMSLNLLKQDKSLKIGIRAKRLKCGWDQDYLLHVLSQ